jgi:oxygen-independent coproporphyrinogen-3 oxidase
VTQDADPRLDAYIERLLAGAEELLRKFKLENVPTVYIGGGTPSILGPARMERLLSGMGILHDASQSAEFTVEANPESIDEDFLRVCRNGGVSRISLGVQSFHEPSLRAVHRAGFESRSQIEAKLALVARYFPGTFSADLITGLPLQTKKILLSDIKRLLAFEPAHVSLYSLTLD